MTFEISRVAEVLVDQSSIFNCTIEEAWKNYMHPAITEQVNYFEVVTYINEKVDLRIQIQDRFYDIVGIKPSEEQINNIESSLPAEIKALASQWGWDDTEVRDKVFAWIQSTYA
ncbi:hypothetical protein M5X17_31210 [Paenibacillus alvei]|uniref:hypothetical protein n=1 Tax=Paenibacillus alvei TaxID=44250 RepID=UPI00227DD2D7|nr:hypothetical protein [Paenibacillus alvei]MCY9738163.1 hypothetical protein [Paenibacillus alvei]